MVNFITEEIRSVKVIRHKDNIYPRKTGIIFEGIILPVGTVIVWQTYFPYCVQTYRTLGDLRVHASKEHEATIEVSESYY